MGFSAFFFKIPRLRDDTGKAWLFPSIATIRTKISLLKISLLKISMVSANRLAIFLASTACIFFAQAASAVSVSPTSLEFAAKPGETVNVAFTISNDSAVAMGYTLSVQDFKASEDKPGQPELIPAKDSNNGLTSWANYQHSQVVVQPGAVIKTAVNFDIPKDAPLGGIYASVFVTEHTYIPVEGVPAVESRLGLLVFGTIGEVPSTPPVVTSLKLVRDTELSPPRSVQIKFKNDEASHVTPSGAVAFVNQFGNTVASLPLGAEEMRILPGASRDLVVDWANGGYSEEFGMSKLKPGLYRAVVKVTTGNGPLEDRASEMFLVMPKNYLIGLGIVAGLLVFAFLRLLFRKKPVKKSKKSEIPKLPEFDDALRGSGR